MRIVYVSQYFPPEPGAPAARVSELSRRWAELGHDVTVLTGFPHHPSGIIPPQYRGKFQAREHKDGIEVLRSFVYATPNSGKVRRSLTYASYAASSVLAGPLAASVRQADLILATSPQFLCALSGWCLAKMLRKPYVLEVRDLWPQSIVDLGVMSERHPVIVGLRSLERFAYEQADMLVSVTDSFVDTWRDQGVDTDKVRVVKNGVDLKRFAPADGSEARRRRGWGADDFVVSYIGTHGLSHALDRLVEVAQRLEDRRDIRFVLAGDGARRAEVERLAAEKNLDRLHVLGPQPREAVPELLAASDLVAVTLRDLPVFETVIPSKIFEIMGCARPILHAVRGESAQIVQDAGAGVTVPPEDVDAMVSEIERLAANRDAARALGRSGRAYVEKHFDRNVLADRYAEYLEGLLRHRRAA